MERNGGFIDRLWSVITDKCRYVNEFASEIGVSHSVMYLALSGRTQLSFDTLAKIKQRYDDVDLNWLICGDKEEK